MTFCLEAGNEPPRTGAFGSPIYLAASEPSSWPALETGMEWMALCLWIFLFELGMSVAILLPSDESGDSDRDSIKDPEWVPSRRDAYLI